MKKTLALLLALTLVLGLFAACGSTTTETTETTAETSAAAETTAQEETAAASEAPASETPAASTEEAAAPAEEEEEAPAEEETARVIEMPLTDETVTLSYYMRFNPQVLDWCQDFSDNLFYSTLEELSNVHIDFMLMHPSMFTEQFNLQMASQDYCDIYCEAGSGYTGGYDQAVDDEVFVDLTPLLEEYAPDYWAILNEDPENLRAGSTDEGRVVFISQVYEPYAPCNYGPQIRADWAEALGFDPAEILTYDDYEAYLEAAYNEYGATAQLTNSGMPEFTYLAAGYDTSANFGDSMESTLPWYQIDGVVHMAALEDGFKEYVTMLADWYDRGLIYSDFMSTDSKGSGGADITLVATGQSSMWWSENNYLTTYQSTATDPDFAVAAIHDAVKEEGQQLHFAQTNYDRMSTSSACVISTACEYPEIALSWLNYRYTEEGAMLANWGVEGVSYEMVDGEPVFTDLITNNDEGMTATLAQFRYMLQNTVCLTSVASQQQGLNDEQLAMVDVWMADKDNSYAMPSSLTLTSDESDDYNRIASDIITFCQENFLKFITGDKPLSDLDDFVATLKSMGIEEAMAIQQSALDRYMSR
jgi:putative aldouronate transport system substrate-binding protein